MAKPEFILQGFTSDTHIDAFQRLFDVADVQKVLLSVAFASEGGVQRIEELLMPHAVCTTAFVGVRNGSTSYQGLARLHRAVNELYTVDTGSRTRIFHPKLYFVRGKEHARLIVGSANLTLAGLHYNIEGGMLLDFDLADTTDRAEVDKIETLFAASVFDYPKHVVKVSRLADLDEMLAANRLIDENVESSTREVIDGDGADSASEERDIDDADDDGIPRIKLKTKPLRNSVKAHIVSREIEHDSIAADEESEPAAQPLPASEIEVEPEPEDTTPFVYRASRPSYRGGEGPRVRAARLKAEAKAKGKKWYFTGLPCRYGHIEDRLVSNGKCRECSRQDSEQANRLGLYR
jgi:HKD family nuclease